MEAKKITLKTKIFLLLYKITKYVRRMLCSALVFQLLSQADVRCKLCSFILNVFVVRKTIFMYLTAKRIHTKCTQFAASINLDKKLKDLRGALHSPFFTILHHRSAEWKTCGFKAIFSASIYRTGKTLIRFPFQSQRLCL